ncbi:class I SAM-dependent methyltransferase [Opitutaceae bacterium]|nr:class I SAM-dependent methyltransferase [bacterium]MDB4384865.1 class I SAM-dependent methyltransferase [Opitutaceae bacterium]
MNRITPEEVKAQYRKPTAVSHYETAAIDIGLWRSEEAVLRRVFTNEQTLLELGCGAGRISLGLWELGYHGVIGTDFSREMITTARRLAGKLGYSVPLRVADATKLPFEDHIFAGVIFGFNGLMQIPTRELRRQALREMRRVTEQGGRGVFTTHDREVDSPEGFWDAERERWQQGRQDQRLNEFGDLLISSDHGEIFGHIPEREEIVEDLQATGWTLREDALRSEIAAEPDDVKQFSAECRFWVVENPS